jgi:TRAP-type mannitol/chloroaromatic compound transport system permease small subunit
MLIKILSLSNGLEALVRFFGKIGAWLSIPLIFIIIFDIITRRFFILGSTKIQEMEWHLHTAIFLLALGFAYIKNSHVRIEIIREKYSSILKSFFEIIGILFFLVPYTCMIIYYGFDFVSRSYNLNEVSSALTGLSHRWIIKSFIPFGMLLLFLAGLSILMKNIAYLIIQFKKDKKSLNLLLEKYPEFKETK